MTINKFGVVIFPGSNCDEDMIYVLETTLGQKVERLWHKEHDLKGCDFIILPGGFSYGDYLRSGAIARFSPIMQEVIDHANQGGYVMGICNGFQVLCEAHLLPGTLLHNDTQKFICENVHLRAMTNESVVTAGINLEKALKIPIAHGEGRFHADSNTLDAIVNNDQVLFKYCGGDGEVAGSYNPNGSLENIAGICNAGRNVFGMMPHPERAADPELGNTDGLQLFESILNLASVSKGS
ncbi:MAG: phosphoribosylformylglycinamidine synthase subunit PurQ [Flavobacteriales bacterium]|nr:phosphoribosylformylglycinamidine synthase subunit PurQ [Flavobacteriales bacterium]